MTKRFVTAALIIGACATTALAAELGDPAPQLSIKTWLKGDAVDLAKGKGQTIYVVEFWATWCPPCRASIPHLTELQKKYKDKNVVFVGVSSEDDIDLVKTFVDEQGDSMAYTVAFDDEKKTDNAYMKAYGVQGIPNAFVVDKQGRVVWSGHPMGDLEKVLDELIDGKFDLEATKKRMAEEERVERRRRGLTGIGMAYLNFAAEEEDKEFAAETAELFLKLAKDDHELLSSLAEGIIAGELVAEERIDLAFAKRLAEAACDATEHKNANYLGILAEVLHRQGKQQEAVALMEKALKIAEDDETKEILQDKLDEMTGKKSDKAEEEKEDAATETSANSESE